MTENEYIPLFLYVEDPIATIIIDNVIIGCEGIGNMTRMPYKAFTIIRQLYESPITRKLLPGEYKEHFIGIDDVKSERPHHCLIGEDYTPTGFGAFLCLEVDVTIENEKNPSVNFHDFILDQRPLDYRLSLSTKESFLLLANICSNTRCLALEGKLGSSNLKTFDKAAIMAQIPYKHAPGLEFIDDFVLDYIGDLQKRLIEKIVTPAEILRLSGVNLLVLLANTEPVSKFIEEILIKMKKLDDLSSNERAMYYTLLSALNLSKGEEFPDVREYYKENDSFYPNDNLEKNILRKFP